MNACNKTVRHR